MDFAIHAGKLGAPAQAAGAETAAAHLGTLMGMTVAHAPAEASPLADAATEMGLMAGETQADEKSLEEFEQDREIDEERRERAQKYRELMGKDQGRLHRLASLRDFLDSQQQRRDNQREIARFFSNPTELYVALGYILSTLEEVEAGGSAPVGGDARARQASEIRWLMEDLEERHGPRIQADMVGALSSGSYEDLGPGLELGEFYGRTLCDFTTVNDVLLHVHENFGVEGFDRALDFLYGALGADMASHRPSMEMTHLEYVQKSLGQVRLMHNAFLHCQNLLQRWEKVHGVSVEIAPLALVRQIMDLNRHAYLGSMHIEAIAQSAHAPDIEHEVLFLQEFMAMLRALPTRLFEGDEGRMKVLEAVQQAVDKAVEREDAWLASRS